MTTAWKTAIITKLNASTELVAAVDDRMDWGKNLDDDPYPRIVLTVRADPRPRTMQGFHGLRKSTVQIDVYSQASSKQASDIAELVIDAIGDPWTDEDVNVRFERSDFEGPEESGKQEHDGYIYRARTDAEIWHASTT
jgi:hypothetical protein